MNTRVLIGIGVVVAVVVLAAVAVPVSRALARNAALTRCDELKAERARIAVQDGGNVTELARLDSMIRSCTQTAANLGASVDLGSVTMEGCIARFERMNQEFAHYRATDYADTVQRGNTRSTINRLGGEAARCAAGAVEDADSPEALDEIMRALSRAIADSEKRQQCYGTGASGCSRFLGSTESDENTKRVEELQQVAEPLRAVYRDARAKRDRLRRAPAEGTVT